MVDQREQQATNVFGWPWSRVAMQPPEDRIKSGTELSAANRASQVVIDAQRKQAAYQEVPVQLRQRDDGEFRLSADGLAGQEDFLLV